MIWSEYQSYRGTSICDRSARGGYLPALCLLKPLHEAFDATIPEDLPLLHALSECVASCPRFGRKLWAESCRSLKKEAPEDFTRALHTLNEFGYPELGEASDCTHALEGENFKGKSSRLSICWVGALALGLRTITTDTKSGSDPFAWEFCRVGLSIIMGRRCCI